MRVPRAALRCRPVTSASRRNLSAAVPKVCVDYLVSQHAVVYALTAVLEVRLASRFAPVGSFTAPLPSTQHAGHAAEGGAQLRAIHEALNVVCVLWCAGHRSASSEARRSLHGAACL